MPLQLAPRHRLLLRAVLGDRKTASSAWSQWRTLREVNEADQEEAGVMPLLASRLGTLGAEHDHARLRGVRRHAVVRQFAIRTEMMAATEALRAHGVTPMAIKGLALASAYGSDRVRAIGDADVLVPHDCVERAVDALLDAGFELGLGVGREHLPVWAARFHAIPMRRPGQLEVDVHWRLSHQPYETGPFTAAIFERAQPLDDEPWLVPHAAHQLGIAVAHGWPSTSAAALRMLVDVAVLLGHPHLDAALVDEVAAPHRLRFAVREVVTTLAEEGVEGAAELAERLPRVRTSDRVMAHVLLADRDGASTQAAVAAAFRRPGMVRARPTALLHPALPAAPTSGARFSLCGRGWWLGDGWATWARRRFASLSVASVPDASSAQGEPTAASLRLGLVSPPDCAAWRRWAVVWHHRPRLVRLHPTHTTDVSLGVATQRRSTVWVFSPRLVVPDRSMANGDRRRVGVAVTSLAWSGGETGHHHR